MSQDVKKKTIDQGGGEGREGGGEIINSPDGKVPGQGVRAGAGAGAGLTQRNVSLSSPQSS